MGVDLMPSGQNSGGRVHPEAGTENAERRAEARSATRHWTLPQNLAACCGRRISRRISGANILFICRCPKTELYGSVSNSYNIHSAMRLGVGAGRRNVRFEPHEVHAGHIFPPWWSLPGMVSVQACTAKHGPPDPTFQSAGAPASLWRANQAGFSDPGISPNAGY